jgi:GntR family transcriptional regulator
VTIDHDAEQPLYLQLAAILHGQIASGKLERRVPSVKTLTQQYGVAQGTAERALALLREEGLIRSVMGRGHFVVPEAERPPRKSRSLSVRPVSAGSRRRPYPRSPVSV